MLTNLSISNYAIIRNLNIDFTPGFCVITGETGAGKSIIMGALSLILGQRADTTALNNAEEKCVVEGRFHLSDSENCQLFFDQYDLDFDMPIILRREITPAGKSRAFINDTPVQLPLMRELGLLLIDIHSQHSNLELGKRQFQLNVIDWFGGHTELLHNYASLFAKMKQTESALRLTTENANQSKADLDYFEFQFKQLDEIKLREGEQEELEQEQELLIHAEEIKLGLNHVTQLLDGDDRSALSRIKEASHSLDRIAGFFHVVQPLAERIESQHIEMKDIASECEQLAEKIEHDPNRLDEITNRLDAIYSLLQKHRVSTVSELISLRDSFDARIQTAASFDEEISKLTVQLETEQKEAGELALALHEKRLALLPEIETEVVTYLQQLGMPNARFTIEIKQKQELTAAGHDEVYFLFSANKGTQPEEINKVASGGELSRLMLAIKTVVSRSKTLPAIIFDEIDSGISGEIAAKMADILLSMSRYMQVINITHLPQIAAKGNSHYLVYKNERNETVETGMRILNAEERVTEIAKMLSSDTPTPEAVANARSLLHAFASR
jgi:DNA repair protein RecN (Recombination protein N)